MNSEIRKNGLVVTGVLALAAALLVAIAYAASPTPKASAATPSAAPLTSTSQQLAPSLATPQTAGDALPTFLQEGPQAFDGVNPASSRTLGSKDGIDYWVALREDGDLCLISLLPGKKQFASETCQTPATVVAAGIGLQVADATHAINAYFLPAGYTSSSAGYTAVSAQLLVGNAATASTPLVTPTKRAGAAIPAPVTLNSFDKLAPSGQE